MKKISVQDLLSKINVSPEEFKRLYVEECWSLVDFKKNFKLPYKQTQKILDFYKIPKRNISQARQTERFKLKTESTVEQKYGKGIKNVSQSDAIKKKKANTFLKNYGVDNIWKSKDYYTWLHKEMLEKYGAKSVPNLNGNAPWYGEKAKNRFKISSIELKIKNTLAKMKIKNIHQFWIETRSYDFLIPDLNIIIEVQGDFWHANPKKYSATDTLNFPEGFVIAKDIWEKDEYKKKLAALNGYSVVYIWEHEINNLNEEEIESLVINKLDTSSV
jgi:G:T-mismatch repair DNA endonuclease (very short patch repair protein)